MMRLFVHLMLLAFSLKTFSCHAVAQSVTSFQPYIWQDSHPNYHHRVNTSIAPFRPDNAPPPAQWVNLMQEIYKLYDLQLPHEETYVHIHQLIIALPSRIVPSLTMAEENIWYQNGLIWPTGVDTSTQFKETYIQFFTPVMRKYAREGTTPEYQMSCCEVWKQISYQHWKNNIIPTLEERCFLDYIQSCLELSNLYCRNRRNEDAFHESHYVTTTLWAYMHERTASERVNHNLGAAFLQMCRGYSHTHPRQKTKNQRVQLLECEAQILQLKEQGLVCLQQNRKWQTSFYGKVVQELSNTGVLHYDWTNLAEPKLITR